MSVLILPPPEELERWLNTASEALRRHRAQVVGISSYEDLLQNTLIRLWIRFREEPSYFPTPYIYTVAQHVVVDAFRYEGARPSLRTLDEASTPAIADVQLSRRDTVDAVRCLLQRVTSR